jgi:hypothetical protein
MNKRLQAILDLIQQSGSLTPEEKQSLADAVKESDKEITITEFKLERTEKVKRTTGILLEQTIAELEQKRKSVEVQNRELEIEAALERVRSRSIAMRQSSELGDLSFELVKQVQALGIATWHCAFNIYDEGQESSTEWGSNANGSYPIYKTPREGIFKRYYEIGQRGEGLHVEVIGEDRCADHYAYLCTLPGVGDTLVKVRDSGIPFPKSQIDHVAYFKYGYLLFITFVPVPEAHDVFKRFANVFEQTYTRFLDLQKAEAQAKEAQIEVAMERIRARAMAMHASSELIEVANVLREQMRLLDTPELETSAVLIYHNDLEGWDSWYAFRATNDAEGRIKNGIATVSKDSCEFAREVVSMYQSRSIDYTLEVSGAKREEWLEVFVKAAPEIAENAISAETLTFDTTYFHFSNFHGGSLLTVSYSPPLEEIKTLQRRAASVFGLAYQRFRDLQNAEAQARESQIQLAMERVRARTMAMQKSDELKDVAHELRVQLAALGTHELETCAINLYEEHDEFLEAWVAVRPPDSPKDISEFHFLLPKKGIYLIEDMLQAYTSNVEEFVFELGGTKGVQWMNTMETLVPDMFAVAAATPDFKNTGAVQAWFCCQFFSGGALIMITMTPPMEESRLLMKRCTQVFSLAYRRFADLKKAEAQAREAQIEAALERVRSRSMGMQRSEELKEVIQVVYEQFVQLNILIGHTGFIMDYKTRDDMNIWLADQHEVPSQITIPYFDSPHWNSFINAKEKGMDFFANHLTFEEKNKFYQQLFKLIPGLPDQVKEYYFSCPGLAISTVLLENIGLYIENFSGIHYSDEENATLMRFGKVFQQTYTRFLDLEKAEEQTRLAQIETSLERVRARAMGMHHSDELSEVLSVLFDQFDVLGIQPVYTFLSLIDLDKNEFTYRQTGKGGQRVIAQQVIELNKMEEWKDLFENMRAGKIDPINCLHYPKESLEKVWEVFDEIYSALPEGSKVYPEDFPDGVYTTQAYCKFGYLGFDHTRAASQEDKDILQRFANEFARLYQRFLDLQKAEAQAREAQIEAALEKVRSRTLAMHTAHELGEVVLVIVEKLKELGVVLDANGVILCTYFQNSKNVLHWIASPDFSFAGSYLLPYFDHPIFKDAWESKMSGADYFSKSFSVEEKNSFFEYAFEHSDYKYFPDEFKQWVFQNDKHSLSFAWQKNSAILIPSHTGVVPGEGHKDILKTFFKSFRTGLYPFSRSAKSGSTGKRSKDRSWS